MSSTSTTISQRTFRVSRISDFGGVLMLVTLPSWSPDPVPVIWDKIGAPDAAADTLAMCRNLRPKSAGYWGMEADFVSFPARNRCTLPVTRSQFQSWSRSLGLPIAAYDDRAWLARVPHVATELIFGGSPTLSAA